MRNIEDDLLDCLTSLLSILSKYGEEEAWYVLSKVIFKMFDKRYHFQIEDFRKGYERQFAKSVLKLLLSRDVIKRC